MSPTPRISRILIKLSGEALMGGKGFGYDFDVVAHVVHQIKPLVELDVEVAMVVGGGNIFRARHINHDVVDKVTADQMGMVATLMNGLALRDALVSADVPAGVCNAFGVEGMAERFHALSARKMLTDKQVVICTGGTGNPYFTTDTAATLRSLELKVDLLIKVTKVNGIFDKDPEKFADAKQYQTLSFSDCLTNNIAALDATAFVLCQENNLPLRVVNIFEQDALSRIVRGEAVGTLVSNDVGSRH